MFYPFAVWQHIVHLAKSRTGSQVSRAVVAPARFTNMDTMAAGVSIRISLLLHIFAFSVLLLATEGNRGELRITQTYWKIYNVFERIVAGKME